MLKVKAFAKLFAVIVTIVAYFLTTIPFYPLILVFPIQSKFILNRIVSFYSKILCAIINIKIHFDLAGVDSQKNYFIVANHLSYLDILVVTTLIPTSFVTSIEMKNTPLLGQICQLAGCLFVERRSRKNISGEIKEIEQALTAGLNVMVFPEATSTNGEKILDFKRSLFQAPISSKSNILPLTFNYTCIDDEPVSAANRDLVCWYGDMEFFPHLYDLCHLQKIEVRVSKAEEINQPHIINCTQKIRDLAYARVRENYLMLQ